MNLDELRTVQSKERQKDSLQNLRPSFYQEVGEYIGDLEDERERVADAADDPFSSPEVGRLTDEIETATDVVEAVYERRMGKLVKQASLAAAGMPADDEGLTDEERDLFEDLVDRIESNKGRVLDVLEGKEPGAPVDETAGGGDDGVTAGSAAERRDDAPPVPSDGPASDATEDQRPVHRGAASDESSAGSGATANDAGSEIERETAVADEPAPDESVPEETDETVSAADVMGGSPPAGADSAPTENDSSSAASTDSRSTDSRSAGRAGPEPTETEPAADTAESDTVGADATSASGSGRDRDAADPRDVDRVTVRITRDVGAILGVDDREYTLSNDDVVTLPEQNAAPLVERDAAEPLE